MDKDTLDLMEVFPQGVTKKNITDDDYDEENSFEELSCDIDSLLEGDVPSDELLKQNEIDHGQMAYIPEDAPDPISTSDEPKKKKKRQLSGSQFVPRNNKANRLAELARSDRKTYEELLAEMGVKISPAKGNHYVNNKELYEHLVNYCKTRDEALAKGLPKPPIDDFIGESIIKIATHLSFRPNFVGYSYRYDMIGDAIENCLSYIDSFDPNKSTNAFSYITQICWCAFIRRLNQEKKQSVIKGRIMMGQNPIDSMSFDVEEDSKNVQYLQGMQHRYVEIAEEEIEKAEEKKREKALEKARRKAKGDMSEFLEG